MDHSWRPRPSIQGNICPTCSISHFPFCPPPSFNENPRFQSYNDYFPQRPRFDPFNDHREPAINLHRSSGGDPSVGFADRRAWHGSSTKPSFDMNPYGKAQGGDSGNYYHRDSFDPPSYGHSIVGVKRMRIYDGVDEVNMNSSRFSGEVAVNSSRFSSDSERILKLIRDHGNAPSGPPGASLLPELKYEANGYVHEKFEDMHEIRDEMILTRRSNYEIDDVQNQGMDYLDRKGSSFGVGPGLNSHAYREDHGLTFGNNYVRNDGDDQLGQSYYGQVENSMPHALDHSRYSRLSAGHFTDVEQSERTQEEVAYQYKGAVPYKSISQRSELKQRSPMSQSGHYQTTEILHENYNNLQRFPPSEELHQSHPANNQLPPPYTMQNHLQPNRDFLVPSLPSDTKLSIGVNVSSQDGIHGSGVHRNSHGWSKLKEEDHYPPISFGTNFGPREVSHRYNVQPPLPNSPPPPLPLDPPGNHFLEPLTSSSPPKKSSLFPIAVGSSADVPSSRPPVPEVHSLVQTYYSNKHMHASTGSSTEEFQACQSSSKRYLGEGQPFALRQLSLEKSNVVDACHIFKQPHRTTRPDHLVIILRGLPGSGKSYLAKMLRDLEVENGGEAPRIHSMDEYFMTEVEKAEESEASKSSGTLRGKKPVMKKVMEYCYEPEMEEAYRSSMLKAFKKTLDEGVFSFIIVDDRNLRVADFAQFWATAKRSGFEVYLLEATYTDPAGCAARNVHNFTLDEIQKMAGQWEEAQSLYLKLDIKSLLHGDDLEESGIQEVDMDMEDGDPADSSQGSDLRTAEDAITAPVDDFRHHGTLKDVKKPVESRATEEVKELRRSKWSDDLDEDDSHGAEGRKGNPSALSGLIQAYSKEGKSVRWGDQGGNIGFSIGAARRTNVMSLVIGPGSGYNLKSNPLSEEENMMSARNAVESKGQNIFQERMRAERESFKAVFDKRRQRIGGFNAEEE